MAAADPLGRELGDFAHQRSDVSALQGQTSVGLPGEGDDLLQGLFFRLFTEVTEPEAGNALNAGQDPQRISEDWQERLRTFLMMREKYLIYK